MVQIIDLDKIFMTLEDAYKLKNYIIKGHKLILVEE